MVKRKQQIEEKEDKQYPFIHVSLKAPEKMKANEFDAQAVRLSDFEALDYDAYEYLYHNIGFVNRCVQMTVTKMLSSGYTATAIDKSEQEQLDNFIRYSRFDDKLQEWITNVIIYGYQLVHLFDSKDKRIKKLCPVNCIGIPSRTVTITTDASSNIMYDPDGNVVGYTQTVQGRKIYFLREKNCYLKFNTIGGYPEGISLLHSVAEAAFEYEWIRRNVPETIMRNLPTRHITVDGGTTEQVSEIAAKYRTLNDLRSVDVTSADVTEKMINSGSTHVSTTQYGESMLSEIAAGFAIPMEFMASVSTIKSSVNDLDVRNRVWCDQIIRWQKRIAVILMDELFIHICPGGVDFEFNTPKVVDPKEFGYLAQCGLSLGECVDVCSNNLTKYVDSDIVPVQRKNLNQENNNNNTDTDSEKVMTDLEDDLTNKKPSELSESDTKETNGE